MFILLTEWLTFCCCLKFLFLDILQQCSEKDEEESNCQSQTEIEVSLKLFKC